MYFAKYLPVEGEIKRGDKVITITGFLKEYSDVVALESPTKVKLFLCSTNIQVGDVVCGRAGQEIEGDKRIVEFHNLKVLDCKSPLLWILEDGRKAAFLYKAIGEISSDAVWVKEGDKFIEDQVNFLYQHRSFRDKDFTSPEPYTKSDWKEGEEEKFTCIVEIECPTCKKFH